MNKLNLIKYSKENEVVLSLTLDTSIDNDYFYIFFNGLKLLVDNIIVNNNKILIVTKVDTFKYLLNTQPVICDFIKKMLENTVCYNEIDNSMDVEEEQFYKMIYSAFNNDISFFQIYYNTYYNHLFFMIDKNIFYLNINNNKLFFFLHLYLICLFGKN